MGKLLKPDDLNWNDYDKSFVALSMDEIDNLLIACYKGDVDSFDSTIKVVRWAEQIRTGNTLLNGLISGRWGVSMHEGYDEPRFYEVEENGDS